MCSFCGVKVSGKRSLTGKLVGYQVIDRPTERGRS